MVKLTLAAVLSALLFIGTGCSKEKDVVAEFGSTITMPEGGTVSGGTTVVLRAVVQDASGNPANGIGVVFYSSNVQIASFSPTEYLSQKSVESDDGGIATIEVYTFTGSSNTGTATITADIEKAMDSTDITVE